MPSVYQSFPFTQNLLNGAAKSMAVNGSSTSQSFSFTASSVCHVQGISLLMQHAGNCGFNVFGALGSPLTNGVLIQGTVNGSTMTIANIKDNADLCTRFQYNQFGNSAVLSILSIVTPQGFGNTNNVFVGYMEFPDLVQLQPGDSITVTIQDNLSSLNFIQMCVSGLNLP